MTEKEAREALFQAFWEYMEHPPKERFNYYHEYQEKRNKIKQALAKTMREEKEKKLKTK